MKANTTKWKANQMGFTQDGKPFKAESKDSRQQRRARRRKVFWESFSGDNAIRDDNGIVPRKIRRDISRTAEKGGR